MRVTSWPKMRICPLLALWMPHSMAKSVDLPAPLGPIMQRISPDGTVRFMLSAATTPPKFLISERVSIAAAESMAMRS